MVLVTRLDINRLWLDSGMRKHMFEFVFMPFRSLSNFVLHNATVDSGFLKHVHMTFQFAINFDSWRHEQYISYHYFTCSLL